MESIAEKDIASLDLSELLAKANIIPTLDFLKLLIGKKSDKSQILKNVICGAYRQMMIAAKDVPLIPEIIPLVSAHTVEEIHQFMDELLKKAVTDKNTTDMQLYLQYEALISKVLEIVKTAISVTTQRFDKKNQTKLKKEEETAPSEKIPSSSETKPEGKTFGNMVMPENVEITPKAPTQPPVLVQSQKDDPFDEDVICSR